MKPLHPDTPKPHHIMFPRQLPPGTLPLRPINFREQPRRSNRPMNIGVTLVIAGYMVYCAGKYLKWF